MENTKLQDFKHTILVITNSTAGRAGLRDNKTKHILLLVEFARDGTRELMAHFESEIQPDRETNFNIKERVG